jgi:hypothetical protein
MSNRLITASAVARMAAVALRNRIIGGSYTSNQPASAVLAGKVGDSVRIKVQPAVTDAQEFTSTTSASDVTQRYTDVVLQKHFYDKASLTTSELSLSLDDLVQTVVLPKVNNIALSINKYINAKTVGGFSRNLAGTIGNRPSTVAHIVAAQKVLDDAYIMGPRVGLVDTTAKASFMQLVQFASEDYGANAADQAAYQMGNKLGVEWVCDPSLGAFDRGDVAGSTTASGTAGASTIAVASLTAATGTIKEGAALTIAGNSTRFVVTADTAIVGNAVAALPIYPALPAGFSPSTAAITWEAAGYSNVIYSPGAVATAIVPPTPLWGMDSAIAMFDGIGMRVSWGGSLSTLASEMVIDCMVGAKVCQTEGGVRICG